MPPSASMVFKDEYVANRSFEPTAIIVLSSMTTTPFAMTCLLAFIVRMVPFLIIKSADMLLEAECVNAHPSIKRIFRTKISFFKFIACLLVGIITGFIFGIR